MTYKNTLKEFINDPQIFFFKIITHRETLIVLLLIFLFVLNGFSQSFSVEGYVSCSGNLVPNILDSFIDQVEPIKNYIALTEINGLF